MRKRGLFMIVFAVVLAGVSGYVVLLLAREAAKPKEPVKTAAALVASGYIAQDSEITAAQVKVKSIPADVVPSNALNQPAQAIGKVAAANIYEGQIVLAGHVVDNAEPPRLALALPRDKVAIGFPATDIFGKTRAIKTGDRVDIMLTLPLLQTLMRNEGPEQYSTQLTMQDIEVLAVGEEQPRQADEQKDQETQANQETTDKDVQYYLTLLVDPQQALILKYIKDSGGQVDIALRSPLNTGQNKTEAVTLEYLLKLYGFRVPGAIRDERGQTTADGLRVTAPAP